MLSSQIEKALSLGKALLKRSNSRCELCSKAEELKVYYVPPASKLEAEDSIIICTTCLGDLDTLSDVNHWRCLTESIWSEFTPVQVMSWRILKKLSAHDWARDLLEQIFLDEKNQKWAEALGTNEVRDGDSL